MRQFERILIKLEQEIERLNKVRLSDGGFLFPKAEITLLGQYSLLANPKVPVELHVPATMDVDAKIQAEWVIKEAFTKILKDEGLEYDEDSALVWIPMDSTFDDLYDSFVLKCKCISPKYGILSKAIKAKEKNRILVRDAIAIYGRELVELILENGGDPEFFLKD